MNDLIDSIRSNPDIAAVVLLVVMLAPDVRSIIQPPPLAGAQSGAAQTEVMPEIPRAR